MSKFLLNKVLSKDYISDKLSICLSLCCILHCIALPIFILLIPRITSLWINDENVHIVLVLLAIPISLFAMGKSLRVHHNYKCIALAIIGLLLLVSAIFMHDLGFDGDHAHSEQAHSDGDGHNDEHSGLGEKLEIFFTVLGGLALLSAHYLNIRASINFLKR